MWWCLLHALLVAAAALVGWPMPIKALVIMAALGHGACLRPRGSPRLVVVAADGSCAVPEWRIGLRPLGARTLVCPFWVRLDVGECPGRRDILLIADQVGPDQWRRLHAILNRVRCV